MYKMRKNEQNFDGLKRHYDENLVQQIEEQEVLASILWDQWRKTEDVANTYSIKLGKDVEMWVTLKESYPSEGPPGYELWAPNLSKEQRDLIDRDFEAIYELNKGCPIIFQWIEKLKEILEDNNSKLEINKSPATEPAPSPFSANPDSLVKPEERLEIVHGPIITDRKSTFQGHVCRVTNIGQVKKFLETLLENKKISQATHNIRAHRISTENKILLKDSEDDGELHAGSRLLHLLDILDVRNVAVIVTRWYGGIHLGPDRFKHINNAARQALVEAGIIT